MANQDEVDMEDKIESWRGILKEINDQFQSRLDENVYEGVHDEKVEHGLKMTASTQTLPKDFIDMCYCTETQEYLLLDKGVEVQRYTLQGKNLQPSYHLQPTMTFERMKWIPEQNCIICHDPMDDSAWILSSSFTSLLSFRCDFLIKGLYYDPRSYEIVAVGTIHSARFVLDLQKEHELEPVTKALSYTDPEFGPSWQLECAALVPETASSPPLLAATYVTTLYLMPIAIDEDADSDGNVECLKKQVNASKAATTTLHYHESSTWIIIGDQQGNVYAWSLKLQCMMSMVGAHEERVRMIAPHSSVCGFLTFSMGAERSKLQVWSCNVRDKTEDFTDFGRIRAVIPNESAAVVAVLAAKLYFLTMHQVYNFFAPLSINAKYLTSTTNPMYSKKVVVASEDNTVRVFTSYGKQLNAQLLPKEPLHVVAANFSGNRKELFTIILKTGEILASDYTTCPMKFRSVFVNDGPMITCLTIYEYFDEIRDNDDLLSQKPRIFYPINVRLIVGMEDGHLAVINIDSGKREYICPAHSESVLQLQTALNTQRIISLGIDRCVKVWRFFGDLAHPLAVYYTLYFIIPITRIKSMGYVLCMANSSPTSKVHQVLMENMSERMRLQHPLSKDHTAPILDMATSDTLSICATSSLDYTIRIWDEQNALLKILEINTCSNLVTFSSFRGDMTFSAGRHLYQIPHKNYLPPKYRAKIALKNIPEEEKETPIPEDPEYKIYENVIDRNELLYPYINTPLLSLDMSSPDTPKVHVLIQQQICALLKVRDEDIAKIRDNLVETKKLPGSRALMNKIDWDKYVMDLMNSFTRTPPEVPAYNFSKAIEENPKERFYNKFGVFKMLFGYDAEELEEGENIADLIQGARLTVHGFLPNSIIYQSIEDEVPEIVEDEIPKKVYRYRYPPEFYPEEEEEEEEERRVSIRLSQLMMGGGQGTE